MMRRRLLLACSLFLLVPTLRADEASQFATQPYLQSPAPDAMTVMWHTKNPAYGWVEYGETDKLGKKADLVIDGLRAANTTIHKVHLTDLVVRNF